MKLVLLTGLFAACALTSCSVYASASSKVAPDFTLKGSNGETITLSKYRGKVVLLDFWSTWCGGCQVEIPWLIEFAKKYRDQGFVVLGVSMDDEGWQAVKAFLQEKGINYPVAIASSEVTRLYSVEAMPMTLLIDRQGRIAWSHIGLIDKSIFETEIEKLL